ncbi:MAG: UvrD-helicase domain-containing protein [Planctomycetota bacterium]
MSDFDLTLQQRAALETPLGPLTVDAGAGCGKTFVLTERFLSHLDPTTGLETTPIELDELVAITFTDAAAREMRQRIREKCRERLVTAEGEAVGFWRRLLRGLEGARISTIHAFASGLIREHAIELGIDPAFAVLDPAEAEVLKSAAVDDTLRDRLAPREGEPDEELIATAAEFDVAGLRSHVRQLVDSAADPAFGRWSKATPDDLIDTWLAYYRDTVAPRYTSELLNDPLIVELRELLGEATPVKPGFADRIADLSMTLDALATTDNADATLKQLQPLLRLQDPETRSYVCTAKDWPDKETKQRFSAVLKSLRGRLEKQRHAGSADSMHRAAELGLQVQRLAAAAAKKFTAAKRQRGVLDNDDLLREAHRLLTHPALEDARSRIAGRVRVLLVDEFQDTNRLQAELVQAIVDNAGNSKSAKGLFVVGDFKQSIYRFRGAEPEVFQQLRAATPESGRLTLSQNFRSQPAVLDFVNAQFGPVFGKDYAALTASRPQATDGPAVEFLWTPPPEEDGATAQRSAEATAIANRLRELIDGDLPTVVDEETGEKRNARPGDIAILFRALSDVAAYEAALRDAGLEYYLVGGHAFYAQQEVYDVLNLLRAVLSECDDIALAGALRSPLFGLPDEALLWLSICGGLNAGLVARGLPKDMPVEFAPLVERARKTLLDLRQQRDRVGAAELLRRAWDATGYDAALVAEFLGTRKLANLEKLHEQARQADASGSGLRGLAARLTEFVNQPPKEALAATTAGDASVVRLMTVHASKGLEFPIVVLPDLNRKVQPDRTQAPFDPHLGPLLRPSTEGESSREKGPPVGLDFWRAGELPAEDAERDRLFYVACTRAADRLILSSCLDPETKLEGPWLNRLAERFDLWSGSPTQDDTDAGLVTVTPPSPPAAVAEAAKRGPSLADAIEEARKVAKQPANVPRYVSPIAVDPADLTTFSVSRLSGRLHRETISTERFDHGGGDEFAVDPRRLGTLVHAVIEQLNPDDDDAVATIDRLVEMLWLQHLRRNRSQGNEEAKRLAKRFVAMPEWRAMGSAKRLQREVEFLLPWRPNDDDDPSALLRGYIDAIYQDTAGDWHVVDYKTNRVDAAGVPKAAERYALQMAVYGHAVESALQLRPKSLTLAFLDPGVSHALTWDAAAHAASIATITNAIREARTEAVAQPT